MSTATLEKTETTEDLRRQLLEAQARAEAAEKLRETAEAEHRALLARRAAAEQEPENESATIRSEKSESKAVDAKLAKQKKFTVFLHQNEEGQPQLPREPVQINGCTIWNITRGEDQEVPEDIYLQLVAAGLTRPQRQQDFALYPKKSTKTGNSKGLTCAPLI